MDAQTLINKAYEKYRGKIASKTPAWGSDKANVALSIANSKVAEWASDSKQRWASLFSIGAVDTVDKTIFTYDLPATFLIPSDTIIIDKVTGDRAEIDLTTPAKREAGKLYVSGNNPKKITFAGTTIDPSLDGGAMKAPGYYKPADMTLATDFVSVDDPNWLVLVTAAELCRNDPAKDNQFANLLGMANELYLAMVEANIAQGFPQGMSIPNEMPQISPSLDEGWGL